MTRATALSLAALLSSCSPAHGALGPVTDLWGNVYPAECRGDLPFIPVVEVPVHFLHAATGGERGRLGLWSPAHVIYVLRDLDPATRAEVVRHERCHEQMWRLTGNARWHAEK